MEELKAKLADLEAQVKEMEDQNRLMENANEVPPPRFPCFFFLRFGSPKPGLTSAARSR